MNASWLLVIELTVPLVTFIVILGLVIIKRRRVVDLGCKQLLEEIKASETAQATAVQRYLTEALLIAPSESEKRGEQLSARRKLLLKAFMDSHLSGSASAIKNLVSELTLFTDEYHKLIPTPAVEKNSAQTASHAPYDGGDGEYLREENERLKKEVAITLSTLNNIFAEYSSVYGEEQEKRDMAVGDILSSMENMMGSVEDEAAGPVEGEFVSTSNIAPLSPETTKEDDVSWDDAFAEAGQNPDDSNNPR